MDFKSKIRGSVSEETGQIAAVTEGQAPEPVKDPQGRWACDVHCRKCWYSLRGLDGLTAFCPECGAPTGDAVEQYRRWWFDERWMRDYVIGAACIMGALVALFLSVVMLGATLLVFGHRAVDKIVPYLIAIWVLGFFSLVAFTLLSLTPVKQRHAVGGGAWLHWIVTLLAWAPMVLGLVLMALFKTRWLNLDLKESFKVMTILWLLFSGVALVQAAVTWALRQQYSALGINKLERQYWLAFLPLPGLLYFGAFAGVMLSRWLFMDERGGEGEMFVIVLTILLALSPMLVFLKLSRIVTQLVEEGVYARMSARAEGNAPAGVTLGPAYWPWWQKRMAHQHRKRMARAMHKTKG